MTTDELKAQVAAEAAELAAAPKVELGPPVGRCGWCGRLASDLTLVEVVHGMERFKCHVCVGAYYE